MIKHVVFFGIVDEAEGKSKSEILHYIKVELENLMGLIPELKGIEVGINLPDAPAGNYDLALCGEFESLTDLSSYQAHPAHQRVADYIAKVKTSRACVDYKL